MRTPRVTELGSVNPEQIDVCCTLYVHVCMCASSTAAWRWWQINAPYRHRVCVLRRVNIHVCVFVCLRWIRAALVCLYACGGFCTLERVLWCVCACVCGLVSSPSVFVYVFVCGDSSMCRLTDLVLGVHTCECMGAFPL